jgi:hypothetical protein
VVGMGYRGLLEVEGVVGGGELVPAATAAGTATTAAASVTLIGPHAWRWLARRCLRVIIAPGIDGVTAADYAQK